MFIRRLRGFLCVLIVGMAYLLSIGPASAAGGTWQHEQGTLTLDEPPQRIIALNWAATEALLLLGVTPVGVADRDGYRVWVNEPELPDGIANVGTRVAPSLEAIAELKPDLIVTSSEMAPAAKLLERIAPTYVVSVYKEGSRPFEKASEMLTTLGDMLNREDKAQAVLRDVEQTLKTQRERLEQAGLTDRPVALVNFLDDRHVRIYAPNGLYQSALNALGLENAWPHKGNYWGFSVVGLEAIAPYPDSRIVVIEPTLPGLADTLASSPFWTYLPPVQREQIYRIEPVWPFGGIFPTKRLATLLADSLLAGALTMSGEMSAMSARQTSPPATPAALPIAAVLLWISALLASASPWFGQLDPGAVIASFWTFNEDNYLSVLAHFSWAPRVSIAILIGCGLGLAGAVTQQILGNPLASPTTLGVEAGGQFGVTVATMFLPGLLAFSPDLVAVSGGLLAIGLVIALTWRLGFSPVTVILAGLVITFFLGAVNMAFLLLKGEWLGNLFIWGAGSLVQNNWQPFMELWPRVLVLALLMLLLMRPLQVLQLGQASASSLGAKVGLIRVLALLLVVLMSATVVSRVGVVAFIGLAAPVLARLLGARTLGARLLWSTLLGAGLLLLADTLAHWASTWGDGSLVPTGTTTALIGGPIILLALQGFKNTHHMPGQESSPAGFLPARRPVVLVSGVLIALLLITTVISMGWSPGLEGWNWTAITQWDEAWVWRGPRMLAAILAGVALGLAGTLIQRMTGNAMASPEMLGISGGAAVVMVLIVLSGVDIGRAGQLGGATLGAAAALGLLILLARKHNFAGNQLLLGGLALYVFMDAGLRLVMASGGTVASQLLNWMYGSTWLVSENEALGLMALILFISFTLLLIVRPLTILPLGDTSASSLGLPVSKARLLLLVLAALLTASATVVIGPLSFVGLIAPHLARVMGQQTVGRQLIVAALAGGLLLGVADYISRVVIYPEQLPAGLLAALVGGIYFLWGLSRHGRA